MTKTFKRNRPTIGVLAGWQVYPGYIDSFLEHVYHGILSAADEYECNLLMGCGTGITFPRNLQRPAWPIKLPNTDFIPVGPWNCDGLIVATPVLQPDGAEYFQELIASGYPLVFAGERDSGPAVVVDNESGIRQAMVHLAEHGHRRIVFVSGAVTSLNIDVLRRYDAYLANVRELGLDDDPRLIINGNHNTPDGQRAMESILNQGVPFSAVLASNDESAIGVMDALHAAGKLIPEDVALIGFDDRFEAKAQIPMLTTVHHPMFELGYQSVGLLLKAMSQGVDNEEVIRIHPQLIIRESCGCLPGSRSHPFIDQLQPEAGPALPPSGEPINLHTGDASRDREPYLAISQLINQTVCNETMRLRPVEVNYLSLRLTTALENSLLKGNPGEFEQTIQQIIEHVSAKGDDVSIWQKVITIIREHLPRLIEDPRVSLNRSQIEDLLDLSRVAISEISRGQFSRLMVDQSRDASSLGQMTALFLAAQNETEIFKAMNGVLPDIGIKQAMVAYYDVEREDPVAWSILQTPAPSGEGPARFATCEFPPASLYPSEKPFHLALLPLSSQDKAIGYVVFDAGNLNLCGFIVRQMMASLKSVRLLQETMDARRIAEEQRKLADEANQLKSRFLSMVSHELRTPLNLIAGLSDMLLKESQQSSPDTREVNQDDLERLYISSRHLDSLIRDVLDLARIDVGQLNLFLEPLDLKEVVEAVGIIGEKLAEDKALSWKVNVGANLPRVLGDRTRLRQVLLNLINNAIKFTARGGITLSAITDENKIIISVSDTGLGIPLDEQDVIFNEFRQSTRTTARGYGGLGLGLAICKHLVEKHGGHISVCSNGEEGQGSIFYITLPVMDRSILTLEPRDPISNGQYILILASELQESDRLKRQLVEHGCQVSTSLVDKNGQWFSILLADAPDVVILDSKLTAEQGWEILKVIKENPITGNIPVLFYSLNENTGAGSILEFNYLTKPMQANKLTQLLQAQGLNGTEGQDVGINQTILVVDDDPDILDLHTRMIETQSTKYHTAQARDGRTAIELIRKLRPALVLLDLMMPEIDGFKVLEMMRQEEHSRNIPVIVVTGQVLTEEDMTRLNRGVTSILGKGIFSPEETINHVMEVLTRQRKPGSESQRTVMKAMAYMHAHFAESISRANVAGYVGMSERHLTRCFTHEIGLTPITYLNRYRIRQAKSLLDRGCESITEVAMDVGFSSSGYFTRIFKDEMGISPRSYLQQLCKGKKGAFN